MKEERHTKRSLSYGRSCQGRTISKKLLTILAQILLLTVLSPVMGNSKRGMGYLFDRYAYSDRDMKDCQIRLANAPAQNGNPIIAYSVTCALYDSGNYVKIESIDYLIDSSQPMPVQEEARDSKRIYTQWVYNVYDVVVSEKRDYFRTVYGLETYGTRSSRNEYNIVIRMKSSTDRTIRYRLYGDNSSQHEGHGMILSPCEKFLFVTHQDYLVVIYLYTFLFKGEDYRYSTNLSSSEIYANTINYEGCRYSTSCRYEKWEWRYAHSMIQDMQFSPYFYSNGQHGGSSRVNGGYNYDMSLFFQTVRYTKYQAYNSQGQDSEHDRGIHIDRIKFAFHSINSLYFNQSWNKQVVAVVDKTVVTDQWDTRMSERPWLPHGRFGVDHRTEEEYQVVLVYQESKAPKIGAPCQIIMTHTDIRSNGHRYEKLSYISIPTDSYYKEMNPNMPDLTQNNLVCGVAPSRTNERLSTTRRTAKWFVFLCDNAGGFARMTITFKNAGTHGPYTYDAELQIWNPSRTMKAPSDKKTYARYSQSLMYANQLQFVKYNYQVQSGHNDPLYQDMFLFAQKKRVDLEGNPSRNNYPSYYVFSEISRAQNMTDASFWAQTPEYKFRGTQRLTFPVTVTPQGSNINYVHVQYTSLHTTQRFLRHRWGESFYRNRFRYSRNHGYDTSNYGDVTVNSNDIYPLGGPSYRVENHQSWQLEENKAKTLQLEDQKRLQKITLYEDQYLIILDEAYLVNEWTQMREFKTVWDVVDYTQKMLDEKFGGGAVYLEQAGPDFLSKMEAWYSAGSDLRAEIAFNVEMISGPTWVECNEKGQRQRANVTPGAIEMGYSQIDEFKLRSKLQPEILPMKWAKHIYKIPHKTFPTTHTNCLMYLYTTHMANGQNKYMVENELGMRVMSLPGKNPSIVENVVVDKAPYLSPVPQRKVTLKPGEDFKIDLGDKVDPEFADVEMVVDLSGARAFSTYDEQSNTIKGTAPKTAKATGYRIDITIREILAKDRMSKYFLLLQYDPMILQQLAEETLAAEELKKETEEAQTDETESEDEQTTADTDSESSDTAIGTQGSVEDQISEIQRQVDQQKFSGVSSADKRVEQENVTAEPFKEIPIVTDQVTEFLFAVREPEPKIQPVQNDGKAKIKFDQKIRWPASVLKLLDTNQTNEERKSEQSKQRALQKIDEENDFEILTLRVLTNENASAKDLGVDWRATKITPYSFDFELLFSDPMVVSQGDEPDQIEVSLNMNQIVDEYGQALPDQVEIIEVPRQVRSKDEKEMINDVSGYSTQIIGGIILGNIFFSLILAASLNQLWIMINGLQIATHLPLLNVKFPANANLFTYVYLLIAKMDFVPDTLLQGYLTFPESESYSLEFATNGYASQYAVENISTAFVLLQSYLLLCLLTAFLYCCQWLSPNFKLLYQKVKQFTFFAAILRFLMEFYLEIGLAVSIGIQKINWRITTLSVYYSNVFTYAFIAILLTLPFFVFMFYSAYAGKMNQDKFYKRWGNLYDGLTLDKKFENRVKVLLYPVLFIIRRQVFIALAIFLQKYLALQLIGVMISSLCMIYYVQLQRPFASDFLNWLETFNEITTLLLLYTIICFTDNVTDPHIRYSIGWVYIGVTASNMLVHIILLLRSTLITVFNSVCLVNRNKLKEDKKMMRKNVMLEKGKKRIVYVPKQKGKKKLAKIEEDSREEYSQYSSSSSESSYESDQISELPPYRNKKSARRGEQRTPRRGSKQIEMSKQSRKQNQNESKRKLVNRSTESLDSVTDVTDMSSPTKNYSIFTRNSASKSASKEGNKESKEPSQYPNVMYMPKNAQNLSPQRRFSQQGLSPQPIIVPDNRREIQKYSAFQQDNLNDIEELGPGDSVSQAGLRNANRAYYQESKEDPQDEIDRRFLGENLNDPEIRAMYIQQRQIEVLRNLAVLGVIRPGQVNDVLMPEKSLKRKEIQRVVAKQYGDSKEPNWFMQAEKRLNRELREKPFLRGEQDSSRDTQRVLQSQAEDTTVNSKEKKKKVIVVKRQARKMKSQLTLTEMESSYAIDGAAAPTAPPPIPQINNDDDGVQNGNSSPDEVKKAQRILRRAATVISRNK